MIKKILIVSLSLGITSALIAKPNVPKGDFATKIAKVAGKQGQFYMGKEKFPKDYFLVSNNLPFLAGLSLHHPQSSTLQLSKEQIQAIQAIKKKTVPVVLKTSKDIKLLELKLAQNIAIESNTAESQYELVDTISKLRTDLTKAHLKCINEVRAILTKEQYKKLLRYATKLQKTKSNKFKIDELVLLPHPGKLIKTGKVSVTKEQKQRFSKEVKSVYPQIFQEKMREAFKLEKKLQKAVAKGKNKEELKSLLDEISSLKREAINGRIDALNQLKKILDKEQWEKINKLTYK